MPLGDAGYILFGPIGRDVLALGTVIFATFAAVSSSRIITRNLPFLIKFQGSELLSGQQALSVLSDNGLCAVYLLLIFAFATLLVALPRTLNQLGWLGILSVILIGICGVVAMIGAGTHPFSGRIVKAALPGNFSQAFLAVTSPVRSTRHLRP